jgi:hypothetical protein
MTATTPVTTPSNAQTTAAMVVAGIDLGGSRHGTLTNRTARCPSAVRSAWPSMTVCTISGSHSPGCLHAAVTASVDRASANSPNMGLAIAVMHDATDSWRRHGVDVDTAKLWYLGDRSDVVDYLNAHGGETTGTQRGDVVRCAPALRADQPRRCGAHRPVACHRRPEMITGYRKINGWAGFQ